VTGLAAAPTSAPRDRRPNVLALPSATTSRLIVLVVAMLTAGLFVGTALHNSLLGASWTRAVAACAGSARVGGTPVVQAQLICAAPAELRRALIALATTVVVAVAAIVILLLAPAVLRRRRRLRPGVEFDAATARLTALAHEAGVRPPVLMVGPARQRDAFCFGRPGRYAVALPKALAVRPGLPVFEVVARHEIAHIAHRDVALSWLARSVWYALLPALALPLVLFVARAEFGLGLDYGWRATVFGAVVLLTQRAVLRSREYDADLRAANAPGVEPLLLRVLAGLPRPVGSRARRVLALHPDGSERQRAVQQPERVTAVSAVDGLTVGFLTALALPLLDGTLNALVLGNANALFVAAAGPLLVGPLLGVTLGIGLWRQAVVARVAGTRPRVAGVVLGVLVGAVLGQAASFANVGLGSLTGTDQPLFALVTALALTGTTVLIAGLGELWAGAAGRIGRPAAVWIPAAVLAALLGAATLWAADILQTAWDQGGWTVASAALTATLVPTPMAVLVVALAVASAWALRSTSATPPAWLLPDAPPAPLPGPRLGQALLVGVLGGAAGGLVLVAYRLIAGPVEGAELIRRAYAYQWAAGAAGAAVLLGLSLLRGRRGTGAGLLAGPVASLVTVVIFFALNLSVGGSLAPDFAFGFLRTGLVLGLLVSVLAGCLTLGADVARHSTGVGATVLLSAVAILLAGTAAGAAVLGRVVLVPSTEENVTPKPPGRSADVELYVYAVAPALREARTQVTPAVLAIDNDRSAPPAARARRIRVEVVGPLREILASAQGFQPADPGVTEVHRHAIAALQYSVAGFDTVARGLETNSPALVRQGQAQLRSENAEWQAWLIGLSTL
jgi:Zn-dependent protease with chaperone function